MRRERGKVVLAQGDKNQAKDPKDKARGGLRLPLLLSLLPFALTGCSGFWEDVTSREFEFKSLWTSPPNPLVVLSQDNDGDHRRKALLRLQEPKTHGGTDEEENQMLDLLANTAVKDPQPLCRLAAIQTLGTFRDPRAAKIIENAYYAAESDRPADSPTIRQVANFTAASHFTPDTANLIKVQSIQAMGNTASPDAVTHLVRVLRQPTGAAGDLERPANLDERIAAARALGNYSVSQTEAVDALLKVLETDKDVALRYRATESLKKMTGKDLPADFKAWNDYLHPPAGSPPPAKPKPKWLGVF
jgi:hypothetical protein